MRIMFNIKVLRFLILTLMGFFIFSWSACDIEKIEYRPTNGSRAFVIKEKDGKKLWGLVHEDDVNSF